MLVYCKALSLRQEPASRVRVFPPKATKYNGESPASTEDLELSDLEISDDEDLPPAKRRVARSAGIIA